MDIVELESCARRAYEHGLDPDAVARILGVDAGTAADRLVRMLAPRRRVDPAAVEQLITNVGRVHDAAELEKRRHIWSCMQEGMATAAIVTVTRSHHRVVERMRASARRLGVLERI